MDTLAGTSWTLVQSGVMQTLAFAEGRASGSGGCNRFSGAYEENGTSISLGPLMVTRRARDGFRDRGEDRVDPRG
jgi:heat shock protein HslJ